MHKFYSPVIAVVLIIFLLVTNNANAQIWIDNQAIYNEAQGYIDGEEYAEAIPLLKLLDKKGITNANIDYKLGLCYMKLPGRSLQAIPYLESAALSSSGSYVDELEEVYAPLDAWLKLGVAYRINDDFLNAELSFWAYKDSVSGSEEEQAVDYYLSQLERAAYFYNNPSNNQLNKVKDNSVYSLYNPVGTEDSLLYYMEARPFYNAVIEGVIRDNVIIERENLIPQIGSEEDLKLLSVSPDGSMLLFNTYIVGKGTELLFSQKNKEGRWSNYELMEAPLNSPSNESFASITFAGNELYFSSNRPGGFGGSDIYVSLKTEQGWSTPQNLGMHVNSPFNEELCYISSDGQTLFLSSEVHLSMGGYDLFVSKKDQNGNWTIPVNLGVPVSTSGDDLFLSVSSTNEIYTSRYNTNQGDLQEIYKVILSPDAGSKKVLVTSQLAFNAELPAKEVAYIITLLDSNKVVKRSTTDKSGKALNLLGIGSYQYDYIYDNATYTRQKIIISSDLKVDALTMESPAWEKPEAREIIPKDKIVLRDVLFEFDSYTIPPAYYNMLDSIANLLQVHNELKAILEGHTDALGSKEYNKRLSQKRAASVANYLREKGVSAGSVHMVGKGEETPIAINNNNDGTDNSEGRKYNRRVSIYVKNNRNEVLVIRSLTIPKKLLLEK